jgi:hypothetical protein
MWAGADFHVVPAYGRDYRNVTQVKEDWHAGKDFMYQGRYISIRDVPKGTQVWARYAKLAKIVRVQ